MLIELDVQLLGVNRAYVVAYHYVNNHAQELLTVDFDFEHQPAPGADLQHQVTIKPNCDAATLPYYMQAGIVHEAAKLVDDAINEGAYFRRTIEA